MQIGRASSFSLPHRQVGDGSLSVPAKLPCFLPPDNPSDGPPGRGHQGHHPRREPRPGVPGYRLPCQGGRRGVQPSGGRLHPCRTVSGSALDRERGGTITANNKSLTCHPWPTTDDLKTLGGGGGGEENAANILGHWGDTHNSPVPELASCHIPASIRRRKG